MSVQRLGPNRALPDLPSKYRGKAFRAIEDVLREDPVLDQFVRTWRTREGRGDDMVVPSADQMPMIALSPTPVRSENETIEMTRIVLKVRVQIFVPGTCVEDALALWEAVEDAIVDTREFRDTNVRDYLCHSTSVAPTGVKLLRPEMPAFSVLDLLRPPTSKFYQYGDGSLSCFLLRPA